MDMAKYVAVGVLAVVLLATVTYESPGKKPGPSDGPTVQGSIGTEASAEAASGPAEAELAAATVAEPAAAEPVAAAEPAAAPSPAPSVDPFLHYVVKKGQTLSDVAGELLGSRGRWRELADFNKDRLPDPNRLREGLELLFPSEKASKAAEAQVASKPTAPTPPTSPSAPAAGDGKVYQVAKGDTLYSIARRELGSGNRWTEIAQLNRIEGQRLIVGTTIRLPK